MKLPIALFFFILLLGCKKADKLTQFNLNYNSQFTFQSGILVNSPIDLFTPEIETNSQEQFQVNDTRKDLVEEINLTACELTILSPENETFSFLKSIDVFIVADGLPETKVAFANDIPNTIGNKLTLATPCKDLSQYIKKDEFTLKVNAVTDETYAQDIDINIFSRFFVDAEVLGN